MERGGMEGPSTKLYKFFILLVHIISTIDPGMSSFFNMRKKSWELVDVWELKPIKMWQWVGENCITVSNGICYDGYKIATTKIVLSINFTNAKWWKIIAQTRILNWFLPNIYNMLSFSSHLLGRNSPILIYFKPHLLHYYHPNFF